MKKYFNLWLKSWLFFFYRGISSHTVIKLVFYFTYLKWPTGFFKRRNTPQRLLNLGYFILADVDNIFLFSSKGRAMKKAFGWTSIFHLKKHECKYWDLPMEVRLFHCVKSSIIRVKEHLNSLRHRIITWNTTGTFSMHQWLHSLGCPSTRISKSHLQSLPLSWTKPMQSLVCN